MLSDRERETSCGLRSLPCPAPPPSAPGTASTDLVEIWGHGSFPASDPPANW
ncbi:hypothetical protein ABZ345_06295 [Lentzea sp. NPDC005914]|uniref:hypothetical protein n=1 Tax=Lentzea sp. NPDC005914 TaxID=3154572 RepID=UPI003400889C